MEPSTLTTPAPWEAAKSRDDRFDAESALLPRYAQIRRALLSALARIGQTVPDEIDRRAALAFHVWPEGETDPITQAELLAMVRETRPTTDDATEPTLGINEFHAIAKECNDCTAVESLDHTDRFRLRSELQRALDFVRSPIPWRAGDPRSESEWCAEHGLAEGDYSSRMGPLWVDEISRLAVMLHTRMKGWPALRHRPDDESCMVWELFDRLVRRCDELEQQGLAHLQKQPQPPNHVVEDRKRTLEIIGDVLQSTQADFERFKTALRNVVESLLSGKQTPPLAQFTVPTVPTVMVDIPPPNKATPAGEGEEIAEPKNRRTRSGRFTQEQRDAIEVAVRDHLSNATAAPTEAERKKLSDAVRIDEVAIAAGCSTGYLSEKCATWKAFESERKRRKGNSPSRSKERSLGADALIVIPDRNGIDPGEAAARAELLATMTNEDRTRFENMTASKQDEILVLFQEQQEDEERETPRHPKSCS